MRKEVLFAIILGLFLGSVLVYGLYTANRAVTPTTLPEDSPSTTPTTTDNQPLTLDTPLDGEIFTTPIATISGRTQTGNVIVIISELGEHTPKISLEGRFIQTIDLIRGGNQIQVTAISPTGQRQDTYLNLVYTTPKP